MNQQQIANLISKHQEYTKCFDELYFQFIQIAINIQQHLLDEYNDIYPERSVAYSNYRWMKYADRIDIEIENDQVIAKYTETGRCGNSDDLLHELRIDLLTTEQEQETMIKSWVANEIALLEQKRVDEHAKKMAEISILEQRLNELKNT